MAALLLPESLPSQIAALQRRTPLPESWLRGKDRHSASPGPAKYAWKDKELTILQLSLGRRSHYFARHIFHYLADKLLDLRLQLRDARLERAHTNVIVRINLLQALELSFTGDKFTLHAGGGIHYGAAFILGIDHGVFHGELA